MSPLFLDDGTPFKRIFVGIYYTLCLNYDILANRNHKGLSVEYFHRFFNKIVTILAEERSTNDFFVPTDIVAGYAWNNAPIDGIKNISSIPTIGR